MALTLFLLKVSNLEGSKEKSESISGSQDQISSQQATTQSIIDDHTPLLSAKVKFRGVSLWSNNVPVFNGTANFITRTQKPKKFNYILASPLVPDDTVRMEFYTVTARRKRHKMIGTFELMLESLIDTKVIDLVDENLSDPNNALLPATLHIKIYYTPPDIEKHNAAISVGGEGELVDWRNMFDDEGKHGGHRYAHETSKKDNAFKKLRHKIAGRADDADTDSYSDEDFALDVETEKAGGVVDTKEKLKAEHNNLELLEKSLGRYEGNEYEMTEWQIVVHVIQARDLPGIDINPYVCVQIDEEKRYTGIHKFANSPHFGEFFTFDYTLPATRMMEKVIYFKVHHAQKIISAFTHTKPIGTFRLDVSTVYNEKEHAFERKWAQLINPENINVTCGHLLLSIAVTERGVPTKNVLGEVAQEEDEFKPSKSLIPAAMPRTLFPVQLKIILYTATEIPEMMTDFLASVSKKIIQKEAWEPVDPYVEVTYNSLRAKTSHRNGTSPVWGEALFLVGRFPPLVRTIKIALKDHAAVQEDRVISSFFIDLFLVSESNPSFGYLPTLGPTWVFLYGSPREYKMSKEQDGLSEGMGEGVCYKGRLLMAIECHPVTGDHTSSMNVQKESGIPFPEAHTFPVKRKFLLFGCIFDVTMIDKSFGNTTISFELSIGKEGYLNPHQLVAAIQKPVSSLTRSFTRIPVDNNSQHFRLPLDIQKPIIFTKYEFHDYLYRMQLANRLKRISHNLTKKIRDFEAKINSKVSKEVLINEYRKIESYVHALPCGCGDRALSGDTLGMTPIVHPNLTELLNSSTAHLKMNVLDIKRRKKLLNNAESIRAWVSKEVDFDESKRFEIVKELNKIARAFKQMAIDAQPALPDVFLWMICDTKRVAYARIPPEDLLFSLCDGEKGLYNGHVQTLFLKTPRSTDKPLKSATNAKVQIFLWLGIEEYEPLIFKQLPSGFDMPPIPLPPDIKTIRYNTRSYYQVRCHCYKARALIASDETGLSDPYLSITVGSETQTTPVLLQSLCPQWNITLCFDKLMHVGSRETAQDTIGNIVVECYDYDDTGDGSDLIGRFSTTAKFNIANEEKLLKDCPFEWFEFKFGEKRAGELLAVFELVEINPATKQPESAVKLEEIPITPQNYPPTDCVTKNMRNKIYQIPTLLIPEMKTYEIEIMFWGLRECRSINFQKIQQADVTIECAGAREKRTIKDVQKHPNFEVTAEKTDKYRLLVNLPDDNNFWPHLSILCIQHRYFGMTEVVGNLVVTDLQKYIEKLPKALTTSEEEDIADAVNELSKSISYDFNRVRKSLVDAYEAALTAKDKDLGKKKLTEFESEAGRGKEDENSEAPIIENDELSMENKAFKDDEEDSPKPDKPKGRTTTEQEPTDEDEIVEERPLTTLEKMKRNQMEKEAGWWNKYYASKAKLRLLQRNNMNMDDGLKDSAEAYAEFFQDGSKKTVKRFDLWNKAKLLFQRAGKAQAELRRLAAQIENIGDSNKTKSAFDESLDLIEADRLKELTLLQTFDIIETELENVRDFEGFNDCLDTFPLYKGKGSSRSDEIGDESRIFAKFKGKFRIREVESSTSVRDMPSENINNLPRMSVNPAALDPSILKRLESQVDTPQTNQQMLQFDYNKNPVILKCRLYIVKAILYRSWDQSGKADPFIKIALNNDIIVDDVNGKIPNTLEPVFGKSFEFEVKLPVQNLLRIQIWDWDMTSSNDMIAETKLDIENRWFSCHRATCGLPKRYDSAGYNIWRDTKKPTQILMELCRTSNIDLPDYGLGLRSVTIAGKLFLCDPSCLDFISSAKQASDMIHRKAHHEEVEEYIRQNTALAALHGWGRKINPKCALVPEHIECRSLFNPEFPETEQGKVEMWLDFFPMSRPPVNALLDITPPKPVSYQLRVTILNTSDVVLNDENFLTGEKTSDIYVKAWILGEKTDKQETDIHYRSLTGDGNFNWRFIFNFDYLEIEEKIVFEEKDNVFQVGSTKKKIAPRIVMRVYDADLLSADDFLGECILDLTHFPLGSKVSKKCKADIVTNAKHPSVHLFETRRTYGWWPMLAPKRSDEIQAKDLIGGKVEAEFSLVTAEEAEKNPVGKAREGPQPLDEPNRPKTSFLWFMSPWNTIRFVLWRNFRTPIILGIIIFIVVVFLLLAIWSLPGEVVRQVSTKIFGNG